MAYPPPQILNALVGWQAAGDLYDGQALGPYPIPLALDVNNQDTILVKCSGGCSPVLVNAAVQVDWEVSAGSDPFYPFGNGSFIDAQAQRNLTLENHSTVFYLPPENLQIGQLFATTVKATVTEADGCVSPACAVELQFSVYALRLALNHWAFAVVPGVPTGSCQPPDCNEPPGNGCELLGTSVRACDYPVADSESLGREHDAPATMYLEEARVLTVFAKDIDKIRPECGIPTEQCSTFVWKSFCDGLSYSWTIDNRPGDTGGGRLDAFPSVGNSAVFVATAPGMVRVRCDIMSQSGNDGLPCPVYMCINVIERFLRSVDFDSTAQYEIFVDGGEDPGADTYWELGGEESGMKGVEFISLEAQEAEGVVARNFPSAYLKGAYAPIKELGMGRPGVASMPGLMVLGDAVTATHSTSLQYAGACDGYHHYSTAGQQVVVRWLEGIGSLPSVVSSAPVQIGWRVLAWPQQEAFMNLTVLESEHRIYTTNAAPLPVGVATGDPSVLFSGRYRLWESAYDISCRGAEGASTQALTVAGIAAHFKTRAVKRKEKDGYLSDDHASLAFWHDWSGALDMSTKQIVKDLLVDDDGGGVGHGSCIAWAQLFRLTLGIQGVSARCYEVWPRVPIRQYVGAPPVFGAFAAPVNTQFHTGVFDDSGAANVVADLLGYIGGQVSILGTATDVDPDRAQRFYRYDLSAVMHSNGATNAWEGSGVAAQGVDNPPPYWLNHVITQVALSEYYDPSYGSDGAGNVSWANINAWVTANVEAFNVVDLGLNLGPSEQAVMRWYVGVGAATMSSSALNF